VAGGAADCVTGGCEPGRSQNGFKLTCAYNGINLGDVLADLVAVALDQAAGDDNSAGLAAVLALVLHHFEDRVDGFLLGGIDEAAGVDDDDFGVFGARGQLGAIVVQQAHHNLGIDEVLGAAKRDEAHLGTSRGGSFNGVEQGRRHHSPLYRVRADHSFHPERIKSGTCLRQSKQI